MAKLTTAKRERLPKSSFACPIQRKYPLIDSAHVSSAKSYYQRENTVKCKGGKTRICKRAKRFGMLDSPSWKTWCRNVI